MRRAIERAEAELAQAEAAQAEARERLVEDGYAFPDQHDMIEMISECCPASVFYDEAGTAIVLADDHTWIARVGTAGNAETAYLATEPLCNIVDPYTLTDLSELQGFRPGWEC
jgi:hypothetical protein